MGRSAPYDTLENKKKRQKSYQQRLRAAALALLGNKCSNKNCRHLNLDGTLGCNDVRLLHIDHPKKDGYAERKILIGSAALYRKVLKSKPGTYRLLCAQCNWLYRYEDI